MTIIKPFNAGTKQISVGILQLEIKNYEVAICTVTYEHLRAIRTVCSHVIAGYCT